MAAASSSPSPCRVEEEENLGSGTRSRRNTSSSCSPITITCADGEQADGQLTGKTTVKRVRESEVGGNISERRCKVGNLKCGLETGKTKSLKAMNCDICCIEFGFCRECSCILCGKATDQSVGDYCSIRCEGKLNDEFVCGHVAHLECALLCHMAGVEQSIGLDVEYYCRRCDKKTNLMMHVSSILHASESLEVRADVEKNLGLALRIIQGTRQIVGRRLQNNIELSLKKLRSGMNLEDIVELHQNSITDCL